MRPAASHGGERHSPRKPFHRHALATAPSGARVAPCPPVHPRPRRLPPPNERRGLETRNPVKASSRGRCAQRVRQQSRGQRRQGSGVAVITVLRAARRSGRGGSRPLCLSSRYEAALAESRLAPVRVAADAPPSACEATCSPQLQEVTGVAGTHARSTIRFPPVASDKK